MYITPYYSKKNNEKYYAVVFVIIAAAVDTLYRPPERDFPQEHNVYRIYIIYKTRFVLYNYIYACVRLK